MVAYKSLFTQSFTTNDTNYIKIFSSVFLFLAYKSTKISDKLKFECILGDIKRESARKTGKKRELTGEKLLIFDLPILKHRHYRVITKSKILA